MLRLISAIAAIVWGVFISAGAALAMIMHANGNAAADPERLYVGLTLGAVPLLGGILALAMRSSIPVIVAWALVAGMVLQNLQFDLSQHGFSAVHVAMLVLAIAGLIASVLSNVNRATAGERQPG